jgi:hypothetical protein
VSAPNTVVDWMPYDHDDKGGTAPDVETLVWINERFYHGVTLGYFDGFTFRIWSGSDDCLVSHWAPLVRPGARKIIDEDDEDGNES